MTQTHLSVEEFARREAESLGLGDDGKYWTDNMVDPSFKASERDDTTLLVSGLTHAHDTLIVAALKGLGYRVKAMDCPDNAALQFGKEFGNRGQCNPTYYTVGNLVKHLTHLRDDLGLSADEIKKKNIFVTAGACGPCRFGMYVTEYRKALRDAGFDGFRVMLFQQQGGLKQATGDDEGLKIDQQFAFTLVRSIMAGDVLNLVAYRIRPYEVEKGATDKALAECRVILSDALAAKKSIIVALWRCRKVLKEVKLDRLRPKPVVSVIGEFWAMTTEGDGNYGLQKFLEQEGAEVDIQGVTNWLLFMIWENKFDRLKRLELREEDGGRKGLRGKNAAKTLISLAIADKALRVHFHMYAKALGLYNYHLPNLEEIAQLAGRHYDNSVRGGEGHMEVGKLIHFVEDKVNHMTVSVKPFGCMPSSGVSDGVQSYVTGKYPDAIFLPIETTGDGKVNVQSRVQMMLFKARQKAAEEFQAALEKSELTEKQVRARLRYGRYASNFWRPRHVTAGAATNIVYAVSDAWWRKCLLAWSPFKVLRWLANPPMLRARLEE
ncbi:2-hydroxyglutaryl-CoA dehydratase [bacterium]|nr:2-hydroxyglutaryl-CoA dehydratase [bacterium]